MPQATIPIPESVNTRPHLWVVGSSGGADETPPAKGRTLTGESPLLVLPGLACEVGLPESVFLQQLHYWLTSESAREFDGRRWVYNTLDQWLDQFPFWKRSTLHDIIRKLTDRGLVVSTGKYNQHATDRTRWYSIAYEHPCLSGLRDSVRTISGIPDMPPVRTISDIPDMGPSISGIPDLLIGTETTPENNEPPSSPPDEKPPKRATGVPAEFDVTDEMTAKAIEYGVAADRIAFETQKFLDFHRAKGSTFKDWLAAWRYWMRNVNDFGGRKVKPKYEPNHPKNPRLFVG